MDKRNTSSSSSSSRRRASRRQAECFKCRAVRLRNNSTEPHRCPTHSAISTASDESIIDIGRPFRVACFDRERKRWEGRERDIFVCVCRHQAGLGWLVGWPRRRPPRLLSLSEHVASIVSRTFHHSQQLALGRAVCASASIGQSSIMCCRVHRSIRVKPA